MHERTTWERRAVRRPARQSQSGLDTVIDSLNQMADVNQQAMALMAEGLGRMMLDVAGTMTAAPAREMRHERRYKHKCDCDCGCDDCRGCYRDDCHCRCCIGDVDLVVYARIGERRVVPVMIENPRRREKEIKLELSEWTSRGGKPSQVTAQIDPAEGFTLQPCEERQVIIVINVPAGDVISPNPNNPDNPAGTPGSTVPRRRLDVDECEVVYADLRVTGCDIRPIRIALAILPYDCGAYEIDCRCGCC
jgi:hypothetical protein